MSSSTASPKTFSVCDSEARYTSLIALGVVSLLALVNSAGCSPDVPNAQTADTATNLMMLYRAYVEFTNENQVPPTSESDLESYIEPENFASAFVSPRDNKPYKIYWGTPIVLSRHNDGAVIAHEQEGDDGKRYLITAHGITEMTDKQFEAAGLPKS